MWAYDKGRKKMNFEEANKLTVKLKGLSEEKIAGSWGALQGAPT